MRADNVARNICQALPMYGGGRSAAGKGLADIYRSPLLRKPLKSQSFKCVLG